MDKTCFLRLVPQGGKLGGEGSFLFTLVPAVQRRVFILIPFVQESPNESRSAASTALLSLPHKEGKYHWYEPVPAPTQSMAYSGMLNFEQWAYRCAPFLWHRLHLNKETCINAWKEEIRKYKPGHLFKLQGQRNYALRLLGQAWNYNWRYRAVVSSCVCFLPIPWLLWRLERPW